MKIISTIVVLFIVWLTFWYFPVNGIHYNTGDGEHTGYITSVERSGIIFKTYTAYVKTDLSSSQEDVYCVIDENLVAELKSKAVGREKITIKYISYLISGLKYCDGESAIITSI